MLSVEPDKRQLNRKKGIQHWFTPLLCSFVCQLCLCLCRLCKNAYTFYGCCCFFWYVRKSMTRHSYSQSNTNRRVDNRPNITSNGRWLLFFGILIRKQFCTFQQLFARMEDDSEQQAAKKEKTHSHTHTQRAHDNGTVYS